MSKKTKKDSPKLSKFIFNKFKNNLKNNDNVCSCGEVHGPENIIQINEEPLKIALVVEDVVEDIIYCNERLGLLLLSNPTIIEVEENVGIRWTYDVNDDTFKEPKEMIFK